MVDNEHNKAACVRGCAHVGWCVCACLSVTGGDTV